MMKRLVREFFFLHTGERRALVALAIILFGVAVFRIWPERNSDMASNVDPEFLKSMHEIQDKIKKESIVDKSSKWNEKPYKTESNIIRPFPFNPNTISVDSLQLMNLPAKVATNLVRYREAGGFFVSPENLQKIYGMDDQTYESLAPYIRIPVPKPEILTQESDRTFVDSSALFGINIADSVMLMSIPGIGISYSGRILKYRKMLGGFYAYDQLWEVYGMDTIRYLALCSHTLLDSFNIRQIHLNGASFRELLAHPYISKAETYAILQYRDFAGRIESVFELENNQILDHDSFMRMLPYMTVELPK